MSTNKKKKTVRGTAKKTRRKNKHKEKNEDVTTVSQRDDNLRIAILDLWQPTQSGSLKREVQDTVHKWIRAVCSKGVSGLIKEFEEMRRPIDPRKHRVFSEQPQGTRNRYKDVICLDSTRVKLKGQINDYIHANYVGTAMNRQRFICTQGPMDSTITDFWRMIVQEKSAVVIQLCNFMEKGLKKCSEYFPNQVSNRLTFDEFTVTCTSVKKLDLPDNVCLPEIIINVSKLTVKFAGSSHTVDHYHWVDWPDHGVPSADLTPIYLMNIVALTTKPIVIHCSAGIGRTGSLAMIQNVMESFKLGQSFDDSKLILLEIRSQRALSIQNNQQYLYVHRCLLEYFEKMGCLGSFFKESSIQKLQKFASDYDKEKESW